MTDPTMSVLWGPQFFGNGDGDVMNGPFSDVRTILGTPIIRNYGTGQSLNLPFCSRFSFTDHLLPVVVRLSVCKLFTFSSSYLEPLGYMLYFDQPSQNTFKFGHIKGQILFVRGNNCVLAIIH